MSYRCNLIQTKGQEAFTLDVLTFRKQNFILEFFAYKLAIQIVKCKGANLSLSFKDSHWASVIIKIFSERLSTIPPHMFGRLELRNSFTFGISLETFSLCILSHSNKVSYEIANVNDL